MSTPSPSRAATGSAAPARSTTWGRVAVPYLYLAPFALIFLVFRVFPLIYGIDGDVVGRDDDGLVGDRLLPGHLPGRPAGHPRPSLRGGRDRRRERTAELLVDHAAAAAAGLPLRDGHSRDRGVPDLRPGAG